MERRGKIDSQIDALLDHLRRTDPQPWIKSLPTLATRSDVINAYWEDWKHVLQTSAAEMAQRSDLYAAYRRQTKSLETALTALDSDFPTAGPGLSALFAAAAQDRRERAISADSWRRSIPAMRSPCSPERMRPRRPIGSGVIISRSSGKRFRSAPSC